MTDLADANVRARIQTEFGTTFFVEAAAGTGKTTALVGRIVGLIRSGLGTLARIRGRCHVHRESSRRDEAAAAPRDREGEIRHDT